MISLVFRVTGQLADTSTAYNLALRQISEISEHTLSLIVFIPLN